jgi:hypothetical protein
MSDDPEWGDTTPDHVTEFLADLLTVCRKHGLALGHEDIEGAFVVVPLDATHLAWLASAVVGYPHGHRPRP